VDLKYVLLGVSNHRSVSVIKVKCYDWELSELCNQQHILTSQNPRSFGSKAVRVSNPSF